MKDMQQMSKRYEMSKGCKTARTKEHLKQGDKQTKFIYYNKIYIDT